MARQTQGPRVHERWAHLRFSVIGQLLAAPPPKGELRAALRALAERSWVHPSSGEPVRFGVSTIERWYYRALKERVDPVGSLRRKIRADAGQQIALSEAQKQALLDTSSKAVADAALLGQLIEARGADAGLPSALRWRRKSVQLKNRRKRDDHVKSPIKSAEPGWMGLGCINRRAIFWPRHFALHGSARFDMPDTPPRSKRVGVYYWLQDQPHKNFGDYISEWLLEHVFDRPRGSFETTFLIGSIIADWAIEGMRSKTLPSSTPSLAFWGCGLRDPVRPLPDNLQSCRFFGARGPLTRDIVGLAGSEPIGDPGLTLRAFYTPRPSHKTAGKTVCIPHINEPKSAANVLAQTGCDLVLSPKIDSSLEALERLIDQIASSSLVLAGSLHAAIIACAYRVPFAFYNSGHIDCPFKWIDFAASVEIEAQFVENLGQYREQIEPRQRQPKLPPILPLLLCAPFTLLGGCLGKAQTADGIKTTLSEFMPHCRWVVVNGSLDNAPVTAAAEREAVIQMMHTLPAADRDHHWVVDRLANDRAPFDQPHNRARTYGW